MEPALDPRALIDQLAVRIYEEPLVSAWRDRRGLPEVLRTVVLILDFDTEVNMNGLGGLLENSIGDYLAEIVDSFEAVGAKRTAEALGEIEVFMRAHGISRAALRGDIEALNQYSVSSFERTHGERAAQMLDEMTLALEPRLYIGGNTDEDPLALLERYVEAHAEKLEALMREALARS
jgi:hypothetical protein